MGSCISHENPIPRPQRQFIFIPKKIIVVINDFCHKLGIYWCQTSSSNMDDINNRIGHVSSNFLEQFIIIWGGYSKNENLGYYHPDEYIIYNGLLEIPERITATG